MSTAAHEAAPQYHPNPDVAAIDRELAELENKRAELLRRREEEASSKVREQNQRVEELKIFLGCTSDADLIKWIRNRGVQSPKAKRLTDLQLRQMEHVLRRGATITATAKYFGVAEATVNTRKTAFGLVGRKNVRPVPFAQALKGMPTV